MWGERGVMAVSHCDLPIYRFSISTHYSALYSLLNQSSFIQPNFVYIAPHIILHPGVYYIISSSTHTGTGIDHRGNIETKIQTGQTDITTNSQVYKQIKNHTPTGRS